MLVLQSVLLSVGVEVLGLVRDAVQRYLGHGQTSEEERIIEILVQETCNSTLDEFGLRFWPPLYIQRYTVIEEILKHPIWNGSIQKVVEFGCAELCLFKYLKSIPELNNVQFVDVDFNILNINQANVVPTNNDYLSMSTRKGPLTVDIFNGSIADSDDRMLGADAVISIELIEHLYSEVLDAVPQTVFEFIKPKLAVFTTPNVEFNVLFPNFTSQFRHDDHKFEWTRKQFKEWATKITSRYPDYSVQFDGIGSGPSGTEKLGFCSQMAIFYRKDMKTPHVESIGSTPYKLMRRVSFPFEQQSDNNIKERTIFEKLRQFISEASYSGKYTIGDNLEIPLEIILPCVSDCCSTTDELENIANKLYQTKKNDTGEWLLVRATSELNFDDYISDSDSFSDLSGQEYNLLENTTHDYNDDEDWSPSNGMSFGESKFCYSTPMTKNIEHNIYVNNVDSFNTVFSNSDLYKTAVDYIKSEDIKDVEISSSFNDSINVGECKLYEDFLEGRKNSIINKEDIIEIENTLICDSGDHEFSIDNDKANGNIIKDNTVIQKISDPSLKSNLTSGATHEFFSKNDNDLSNNTIDEENDDQVSVCLNRTLLDESGYTEKILNTDQ